MDTECTEMVLKKLYQLKEEVEKASWDSWWVNEEIEEIINYIKTERR